MTSYLIESPSAMAAAQRILGIDESAVALERLKSLGWKASSRRMQDEMNSTTRWLVSILVGELVTLLTGLFPTTPASLVGATWYGFPLAWLIRMIVAPEYNPWRIELLNFFGDVIIWTIMAAIALFVVDKVRKPAKK